MTLLLALLCHVIILSLLYSTDRKDIPSGKLRSHSVSVCNVLLGKRKLQSSDKRLYKCDGPQLPGEVH